MDGRIYDTEKPYIKASVFIKNALKAVFVGQGRRGPRI